MRLSVTQIRVAILVLNLLLTLLVAVQAVHAVFVKPEMPSSNVKVQAKDLTYGGREGSGKRESSVHVVGWGEKILSKPPPPVLPPSGEEPKAAPAEPPPPAGPDEYPPGPLDTDWEYVHGIVSSDPRQSKATLQKKDPAAAAGMAGSSTKRAAGATRVPPRIIRSTNVPGRPASSRAAPGAPGAPASGKTLGYHANWKDEDAKIDIWVVEITPERFVYEDALQNFKLFALRHNRKDYRKNVDGVGTIKPAEVPPDAVAEGPPEEKEVHFLDARPNGEAEFQSRKSAGRGSINPVKSVRTSASSASASPAHPAEGPGRPLSQEEQLHQLKETMEKIPKSERAKLEKALGGRKK